MSNCTLSEDVNLTFKLTSCCSLHHAWICNLTGSWCACLPHLFHTHSPASLTPCLMHSLPHSLMASLTLLPLLLPTSFTPCFTHSPPHSLPDLFHCLIHFPVSLTHYGLRSTCDNHYYLCWYVCKSVQIYILQSLQFKYIGDFGNIQIRECSTRSFIFTKFIRYFSCMHHLFTELACNDFSLLPGINCWS